jgi:preprotein translocase subunit SecF
MQDFYQNNFKKFLIIPLILSIVMLFFIFVFPGIQPGIDLTGGNMLIIRSEEKIDEAILSTTLNENFSLKELKISTIASPTGYGAWIQYNKDPFIVEVEELLNEATSALDVENDDDAIRYSSEALVLLNKEVSEFSNSKIAVFQAQQALADYKEEDSLKLQSVLIEKLNLKGEFEFQKREISPTLGEASFSSSLWISLIGVILITLIVFIAFRQLVPSAAIIQAMIFDVLAGLAGMTLLNIPLSLTTLPALLMLIGYSVDTDIMLTSRVLKGRDGASTQRATSSMKTGITMTLTSMAALLVMILFSYFYQIDVIYQISVVLFFGLIGDLIATWFMNAPILLWWVEKKEESNKKY